MRKTTLYRLLLSVLFLVGLSGCYRATVLTEVQKDGTWKRTTTFTASSSGGDKQKVTVDEQLQPFFDLPRGEGWQISRSTSKDTGSGTAEKYIAVRRLRAGDSLDHDVVIKDTKTKSVLMVNSVRVREIAPGQIEYVEFYRWKGEKLEKDTTFSLGVSLDDVLKIIQQVVPEGLLTLERRDSLAKNARYHMWLLLWGPNDPLANDFLQSAFSPDGVKYKLSRRLLEAWQQILDQTFGEAIPRAKSALATKAIAKEEMTALEKEGFSKKSEGNQQSSSEESPVPITVRLRLPGTVLETNGEHDPLSEEIYWTFYAPATRAKDIVLRAVCKVER